MKPIVLTEKSEDPKAKEKSLKECDYFAEAQKRRIDDMVKNGMEPQVAKNKEIERYTQLLAHWTTRDYNDASKIKRRRSSDDASMRVPRDEGELCSTPEEDISTKSLNNFSGGQIRRIVAMIKCGIEPEKARDLEQERYEHILARRSGNQNYTMELDASDGTCSEGDEEKLKSNYEQLSGDPKRRIFNMVCSGDGLDDARIYERVRYSEQQCQKTARADNIPSTSKHCVSTNSYGTLPRFKKPRYLASLVENAGVLPEHCIVVVMHAKHPDEVLTADQIDGIKRTLLEELDKSVAGDKLHQFVGNSSNGGCLTVTCHNFESKTWLIAALESIKPWPNAKIKTEIKPEIFTCVTELSARDFVSKEVFLARLAKQNTNLRTADWRILNIKENENNGETITFSVDKESKEYILKNSNKLFFNLNQIKVEIEEPSEQIKIN